MQYPVFGGSPNTNAIVITSANTASDGSGTINVLLTAASKFNIIDTINTASSKIFIVDWDKISDSSIGIVKNGDIVSLTSTGSGIPSGLTVSTDYIISNLSIISNTASFNLLDNTLYTPINITTTGSGDQVMRFPCGTRVDSVVFINSQNAAAASAANMGKLFYKHRNSSTWRIINEISLPTVTRTVTVIGNKQTMTFTGGLILPEGSQLGATIPVRASAVDDTTVYTLQGSNF